jgi:hypothetical protein
MTTTQPRTSDGYVAFEGLCDVCGHPDSAHDRIALRYCAATFTNVLPRSCICSSAIAHVGP